jgi:hypothetical protein
MFRPTVRLARRQFVRRTAAYCDSRWFRLAVVVLLTCLLLPVPQARAEHTKKRNAHGLQSMGVACAFIHP